MLSNSSINLKVKNILEGRTDGHKGGLSDFRKIFLNWTVIAAHFCKFIVIIELYTLKGLNEWHVNYTSTKKLLFLKRILR